MLVCDIQIVIHNPVVLMVSILVLVDVGLRLSILDASDAPRMSFNPCFSGCWSATMLLDAGRQANRKVSILVLVDVGLRQCHLSAYFPHDFIVSILVLVDVGLRHAVAKPLRSHDTSFNPCFSGCWSATIEACNDS